MASKSKDGQMEAPARKEELSDEDRKLQDDLNVLVDRLDGTDTDLHVLEDMKTLIRASMTPVPKPLKFMHTHYPKMKEVYQNMNEGKAKQLCAEVISVLAMTSGDKGDCINFRLKGTQDPIGDWGHEYVRHLTMELAEDWKLATGTENFATRREELLVLVKEVIVYNMRHNGEVDACDLLTEIDRLDLIINYVEEVDHSRVCLYLLSCVPLTPDPDNQVLMKTAKELYTKFDKKLEALRCAIMLKNTGMCRQMFLACDDTAIQKQMTILLGRHQVFFELEDIENSDKLTELNRKKEPNIFENVDELKKAVSDLQLVMEEKDNLVIAQLKTLELKMKEMMEDKDNLVTAVRKLKSEGTRMKQKISDLQKKIEHANAGDGSDAEESDDYPPEALADYDEINSSRDFMLVGANRDPFSLQCEVPVIDPESGQKFISAECLYAYQMAKHFNDQESMKKLLETKSFREVIDILESIKDFDEKEWEKVKVSTWVSAQKLKITQSDFISKLLVTTGTTYIALASQDKTLGTGWRITRSEACQLAFWDGQNLGGKALMKIRHELKEKVTWKDANEREAIGRKAHAMKRFVWRRQDPIDIRRQSTSAAHEQRPDGSLASGSGSSNKH